MNENDPRVTQLDIARKAGVHQATVCLALKDHPRIPAETKQRILKIAEELGYHPDPMLSSLAAYRKRLRTSPFHGILAWLADTAVGSDFRRNMHYSRYYSGAKERAIAYGYKLEIFELHAAEMTPQRLVAILKARGISGILVSPPPNAEVEIDFLWDNFSAVTFAIP